MITPFSKPITGASLIWLTIALSLGIFMNVLDTTIANVSIPSIAGDLGVSPYQGTWIITSFAVSAAIVLPITGWMARRYGQVRLFIVSTVLFTLFSCLCGLAVNLPMMILFRALQGMVAAPLIPLSQSLLLLHYPEEKKWLATALWSMTAVVAPVLGPLMGGIITENWSWPWIFYINFPLGAFSALSVSYLLAQHETLIEKLKIDKIGLSLLVIGVGSLQILLDEGKNLDWFNSDIIVSLGIIAVIALSFFIVWEFTESNPIVDLNLFKSRNFLVGTTVLSLGFVLVFGNMVILPLWLQTQMNYTPSWAGLVISSMGVLTVVISPVVGRIAHNIDLRWVTSLGFIIFTVVCFWSSAFNVGVTFAQLVLPRFLQGAGLACFFVSSLLILLSDIPQNRIADAMGIAGFLRLLGSSFGTSLSLTLWERREAFHHSQLAENITSFNANNTELVAQAHALGLSRLASYAQIERLIQTQSCMLATNDFFWICGVFFLVLMLIIWLTKPPFATTHTAAVE